MKLLNIPFLLLTIAFISGIYIGYSIEIPLKILIVAVIILCMSFGVYWWFDKRLNSNSLIFSVSFFIMFTLFGVTIVQHNTPENRPSHYKHLLLNDASSEIKHSFKIIIAKELKPTDYYKKYIATITQFNAISCSGEVLLYIENKKQKKLVIPGDILTIQSQLKEIPGALNPDQFDYAENLKRQHILHKITVAPEDIFKEPAVAKSKYRLAHQFRSQIVKNLNHHPFTEKQKSIMKALLLGQRQDISKETFSQYRDAGAIHLLAVSGLHVGILFLIFNFILRPLHYFGKKGTILKTILCIVLLWCFAVIAGLSPSVLRAVTMFSFLSVGLHLRSRASSYNSLLLSLFVLLCFQPHLIFSIGFQLSYVAVFFILWLQPYFYSFYKPRNKIDKIAWETTTVTISAQLGLLPLTLFYFHQFPLLFFIANLIIIPFLGGILGLGILVLFLSEIHILPDIAVTIYGSLIDTMNFIIAWVAEKESFIVRDISFSKAMLFISYPIIILSILLLKKFSTFKVYIMSVLILFGILLSTYEKYIHTSQDSLLLFHQPKKTILGRKQGNELILLIKDSLDQEVADRILKNYKIHHHIYETYNTDLKNVYQYNNQKILFINKSGVYKIKDLHPEIVVLTDSPQIHFEAMINYLCPTMIIADGSNYKSFLDLWERSSKKYDISFHRTDTQGAFIIE